MPRVLVAAGLAAYRQAKDDVFGLRSEHRVAGLVADKPDNNLIERLTGTIRERTKVMRGMKTKKTANELLEGWTVHYNYFRPHKALRGRTPAKAAGAVTTLRNWEDVARLDVRPISRFRSQAERQNAQMNLDRRIQRDTRRVEAGRPMLATPRRSVQRLSNSARRIQRQRRRA